MPERVTKEERLVSMVIEKARDVKEMLYQSMYDGNISPAEDKSEAFKLKRPKAETPKDLIPKNQKTEGYGLAGQMTEFKKSVMLIKSILKQEMDNPFLNAERRICLLV